MLLDCAQTLACDSYYYDDIPVIFIQLFFAILFLQSGIDKILNYKSELQWMTEHFSKSILRSGIAVFLPLLTVMEILCGVFCVTAIIGALFFEAYELFAYASVFSSCTLLSLFFGQRVAKNYAGAANLTGYFILSILGIYLSI